jgi:hypothetical protein
VTRERLKGHVSQIGSSRIKSRRLILVSGGKCGSPAFRLT